MIRITEGKSYKVSGITSLYIKVDIPTEEIINIILACDTYNRDKKTDTWEVPVTSLSFLLDKLTYEDDIEFVVQEDEVEQTKFKPILEYKTKPFDYQLEAIEYGLNNSNWLLLDEAGLGKTMTATYLAEELRVQKGIKHCLVICGINALKTNWKREIAKHSNLDSIIIGTRKTKTGKTVSTSIKERVEQLLKPIDEFFIIINIESLRSSAIVDALNKGPNKCDMIIFDELHKASGYASSQSEGLVNLEAKYTVGMTGTLISNNPIDTYIPLVFIKKESKNNVTRFKNLYCIFDKEVKGRIVGFKNMELLKEELDSSSLRRTKDILNLPPKNFTNEYIEMDDSHANFYEAIVKGVKEEADLIKLNGDNLLALTTRLRQATSCPQLLTSTPIINNKIERCVDLVEQIISQGDKVVIMSVFKEPLYEIERRLKDFKPLLGLDKMSAEDLQYNIDEVFQKDDEHKIFAGTIQKIGTGFTMTRARYMIFLDQPWTDAIYSQATDRIFRIGTTKSVFIINLICENTIDVAVNQIVKTKKAISDYMIDGKADANTIKLLSKIIEEL